MKTNHRFLIILLGMLGLLLIANVLNVWYNFRISSQEASLDKATSVAEVVRGGLTAHMVNGTMDKRQFFLDQISREGGITKLWVTRADSVNRQYGAGLPQEVPRDALDRKVLSSGKLAYAVVHENGDDQLRVSVPYAATLDETSPSCFSCHKVKPGTVLGAVSMTLSLDEMRTAERKTLLRIFLINIVFIVLGIGITNYFFKPYVRFFENLKQGINEAYRGNFSYRFPVTLRSDGMELTEHLNELYDKMDETFGRIQKDLGTFVTQGSLTSDDPLRNAQVIIRELSDIYKFKHTIEFDADKTDVYKRLIHVIQSKYGVKDFSLYEVDKHLNSRQLVYSTLDEDHCTLPSDEMHACRAYRTGTQVYSNDFHALCSYCAASCDRYLCLPISVNDQVALTLTLYAESDAELKYFHQQANNIKNYFETAKPVIESHILTGQLRESSLRDGMTTLYNRRFLEEFIDNMSHQVLREEKHFHVLMIDIDYFKLINDTYGHDAGDIVIKRLAEILKSSIRVSDLPIRYGGEEFLVLLHNSTEEGAWMVAEKIHRRFAQAEFKLGTQKITKTLSIGVASFPEDSDAIWKVIKYADIALYEAKRTGRDKVVRYTSEMFHYEDDEIET